MEDWPKHKKPCKELAAATKKKYAEEEARSKAAREAVTNPPCAFCGTASFETCTNCMATHYCSRACQLKHWPVHKIPCKESPIYKANQELAALKKMLAEQEQALGVDHERTLCTVNEIGLHLRRQGKLKEAEEYCRRTVEGYERTLGRDHPGHAHVGQQPGFAAAQTGQARPR